MLFTPIADCLQMTFHHVRRPLRKAGALSSYQKCTLVVSVVRKTWSDPWLCTLVPHDECVQKEKPWTRSNLFIRLLYRPQIKIFTNEFYHSYDFIKEHASENDSFIRACTFKVTGTKQWRHMTFSENIITRLWMCSKDRQCFSDHFRIKNMRVGRLETNIRFFKDLIYFRGTDRRSSQLWRHRLLRYHATRLLEKI